MEPGGLALVCPQCDRKPRVPSRERQYICADSAFICTRQLRFWLQDHEVLDSLLRLIRKKEPRRVKLEPEAMVLIRLCLVGFWFSYFYLRGGGSGREEAGWREDIRDQSVPEPCSM